MQLAAGLKAAGKMNGESDELRDRSISLERKTDLVLSCLEAGNAVVLLDEPDRWGARSDTTGHFAERAELVVDALLGEAEVTRVFTGPAPVATRAAKKCKLPDEASGERFLKDEEQWGPLAKVAASCVNDPATHGMTALELRLLVAAHAVGAEIAQELSMSRRDRADALLSFLRSSRRRSALGAVWRQLATVRGVFGADLLDELGSGLDEADSDILRFCLLLDTRDGWMMHENLRADARRNYGPRDDPKLTSRLTDYYDSITEQLDSTGSAAALIALMDTAYYAASACRTDVVEKRGCFVEQLDLLGKMLSLEEQDYQAAVDVFELALSLDNDDDYAAHYIGFNLDRLGRAPDKAEAHYRLAIDLNAQHVWWRSRLISFLAERGQLTQARREWNDALDSVLPPDGTSDVALYETLHGWVTATLLRLGELRFARAIMHGVPEEVVERSPMIRELQARLRAFEIADTEGVYVPANLLRDGWWKAPALLQARIGTDGSLRLRRWLACRIEAIDDDHVELRVADVTPGAPAPRYGRTRVDVADFNRWSRDDDISALSVGRFVEIGLYSTEDGQQPTRLLRVHTHEPVGADAPVLAAPLDRWHQELAGSLS
jgi:tetratricopeptide (TPR) repeat protein